MMVIIMNMRKKLNKLIIEYNDIADIVDINFNVYELNYQTYMNDLCSFNQRPLLRAEKTFLEIKKIEKRNQIIMNILTMIVNMFRSIIPNDDFNGMYRK